MTVRLRDVASVIRSKNAGPFELTLDVLLKDGAKRAAEIKEEFVPTFPSIEAFFQAIDRLDMDKDAVIYNEDGTVTLDIVK